MARMTRARRSAPRWTRDDILREAAETFALLPRPSTAARCAFVALLGEFWPDISDGTRTAVEDTLRGSTRVGREVLEALDALCADAVPQTAARPALIARAADVSHRAGMKVTATISGSARPPVPVDDAAGGRVVVDAPSFVHEPPLLETGAGPTATGSVSGEPADGGPTSGRTANAAADHARAVLTHLASEASGAAPALQPAEIEATLRAAGSPAAALAGLLDIPMPRAESIVALPRARGSAVALRALGVAPELAEELVVRWRGRAPNGFSESYAALSVPDCLDAVAAWRRPEGAVHVAANTAVAEATRRSA